MLIVKRIILVVALATVAFAQSPEPPLSDSRLSIHTLLREDIFAGFLEDDMKRFSRGEKNIELLMEKRPNEKADLLAWKAGASLYRAVRALDNNRPKEFEQYYKQATDLFAEAQKLPSQGGAAAVTGGSYVLFADRLPKEYRAAAWAQAYDSYKMLWKFQGSMVDKLPLHLKGELLGGLAQSAQRTGRDEESQQYLDKMMEVLSGTPYANAVKRWKDNPKVAANTSLTCMTCHDAGRLSSRLSALNK